MILISSIDSNVGEAKCCLEKSLHMQYDIHMKRVQLNYAIPQLAIVLKMENERKMLLSIAFAC